MSKHAKYVPKHRHAPEPTLTAAPRKILRSTVVMSSVAVAATGVAVSGGVLSSPAGISVAAQDLGDSVTGSLSSGRVADREPVVSRGSVSRTSADRRDAADPAKEAALAVDGGRAVTRSVDVADGDPRDIARALMPQFGFGADQFGCLDSLWTRESNWSPSAHNASSGAHGIPQALPGSKMASAGPDWATNPVTQITWGLGYIQDRYGSPCGAWGHSQAVGWY
ncbi:MULTISPECIES: lytic transglycosylase domain-containing protein [unclassified Nocardioides]|uniref:aggregation-promoting factor C-terminal-like domain-containing protein n=1 Tax=unclassified Nocardioides TaxID=2615069 RepID=UPI000056F801|nr:MULTISPECIES: lytic transglycosylase domain-containing protein [unclassified Nocardioides]ABL80576.1 secreted protein [Nocardioides sp. JS614]